MRISTTLILIAAGLAAWPPSAAAADAVYLYGTDASGQPRRPWGVNTNEKAMTVVFGEWSVAHYNDEGLAAILASRFAYLEGGDASTNQMAAFLDANRAALEAWVKSGGRLLIVAAPNQGGNFQTLFGAVLNYSAPETLVRHAYVADTGHGMPVSCWPRAATTRAWSFSGGWRRTPCMASRPAIPCGRT